MARLVLVWILLFVVCPVLGQDEAGSKPKTETDELIANQSKLAQDYELLEEKLFTLYEYERDLNPVRSKVLKRAYLQSQEKMTTLQYNAIVQMLRDFDLKGAEARQEVVLTELKALLELLESEDRGKRVRDELRRNQEYLKEVERLLRIQRGIRGQAEGNADQKRLAKSQSKAAERAGRLAKDIKDNEEGDSDEENDGDAGSKEVDGENAEGADEGKKSESNGDASKGGDSKGQGKGGSGKAGQPSDSDDDNQNENNGDNNDSQESDGSSENQSGKGQGGQPGQGQGGQSQQGDGGESSPPQSNQNPVRKRIEAAQDRMRRAQKKLEQSSRNQSIEEMKAAEAELAAARKALEEILRQLREEEVERVLAMLEGRFRQMLERQVRVYETTRKLDSTPKSDRNTEFEIRAGKLSVEQNSIAVECDRALLLLREDGSSVAFPETVEQLHEDMIQVGQRLSSAKTGQITIEIEEDIIETLEYLIQALVVTQKDLEKMKQAKNKPQQGGGQPGSKPLVDSLAEIKMLRGLQDRIYRRHQRYSRLLQNPDDLIGSTDDPDLQRALIRLSDRQQQLTDIARDIVVGKNQ